MKQRETEKEREKERGGEKRDAPLIKTGYSVTMHYKKVSFFIQKEGSHGTEKAADISGEAYKKNERKRGDENKREKLRIARYTRSMRSRLRVKLYLHGSRSTRGGSISAILSNSSYFVPLVIVALRGFPHR